MSRLVHNDSGIAGYISETDISLQYLEKFRKGVLWTIDCKVLTSRKQRQLGLNSLGIASLARIMIKGTFLD